MLAATEVTTRPSPAAANAGVATAAPMIRPAAPATTPNGARPASVRVCGAAKNSFSFAGRSGMSPLLLVYETLSLLTPQIRRGLGRLRRPKISVRAPLRGRNGA